MFSFFNYFFSLIQSYSVADILYVYNIYNIYVYILNKSVKWDSRVVDYLVWKSQLTDGRYSNTIFDTWISELSGRSAVVVLRWRCGNKWNPLKLIIALDSRLLVLFFLQSSVCLKRIKMAPTSRSPSVFPLSAGILILSGRRAPIRKLITILVYVRFIIRTWYHAYHY